MSVDFTKPIATADRAQNLTDTRDTLVATAKLLAELPRETTVTARLKRHKYATGWRGRVARWVAAHLLDAFDPDGKHI